MSVLEDFKKGERRSALQEFEGQQIGFPATEVGHPPIQEADFSRATPQELEQARAARPIQGGQQKILESIDRAFGVPESLTSVSPTEIPAQLGRTAARAAVGAVGFLPVLAERFIAPPEGQSRLEVATEEGKGLLGMLGRFPLQLRALALRGVGTDPTKAINPADQAVMSLAERITGKPFSELSKEIEQGLVQAPEEPFFSAGILAGGLRGGAKITKRLQKVKEPPPTIEPTGKKVELPEARPEIDKLPLKEVADQVALEQAPKAREQIRGAGFPPIERQKGVPLEPANLDQSIRATTIGRQPVAEYFRREFDVPIRTGRIRQRAAGIFKVKPEVIRIREANDLDTIAHELGHFVDKKIGIRRPPLPKGVSKELFVLGKELYGDKKPVGGYKSEGVAEYMAYWLTTERAGEVAPRFHKFFQEEVLGKNPEFAKKLRGGRELVQRWRKQGAIARTYGNIDFAQNKLVRAAKEGRLKTLLTDIGLRMNTLLADDLAPLQFVEKRIRGVSKLDPKQINPITSPTMIARAVAKSASGKAREMVLHGTFDPALKKTGASLRDVLKPVSRNMKDFLSYSYAKRAQELWKRNINPGISRRDANFVTSQLAKPEFEQAHQGITAFENRVMDYLVESGGLSREAAQAIIALNPSHIPLKRSFEGTDFVSTGGRRLVDTGQPIKRIRGSGRAIKDPLESILSNTATIINFADKTRVMRALVNLVESRPGTGKWLEKIPTPKQATRVSLKSLKKQLQEAGVDLSGAKMDEVLTVYSNAGIYRGKDNIVSLWRNGKREFYEVDKRLYGTLKAIDEFNLPPVLDFLFGRPARAIRLGATGLNLGFGLITNPIRDAVTFGLQTEFARGTPELVVRGFVNRLRPEGDMNTLFRRSGADFSQFLGMDRKQLQKAVKEVLASDAKKKALNVIAHPIEAMKDVISITEAAPRIAEMRAAIKFGKERLGEEGSAVLGARAASEVTVNFRRVGTLGKWLNQMIPFWNASVQGTLRFARFAKEHPVKASIKGIAGVTIPTIGIWMLNRDRKWYRESAPWLRYGFWNLEVGTNEDGTPKILRVPRPFEWGVTFGSTPEMVLDYWYAREPSIVKDGLEYMIKQTIPIGAEEIPPTLKIPLELSANYDFFRERPIDPFFEVKYKVPEDRFSDYTPETLRFLGQQFGVSPRKLQHLIRSSTGGLGLDVLRVGEQVAGIKPAPSIKQPADLPVVGRLFARTPTEEQRLRRLVFGVLDELQKIKNLDKAGKTKEARLKKEALELFLANRDLTLKDIKQAESEFRKKGESEKGITLRRATR